jgi:hypothetical protein
MDNEYTLSHEEQALLGEFQTAQRDLQQQVQGAFKLICRQRALEGEWRLDGAKLLKVVS